MADSACGEGASPARVEAIFDQVWSLPPRERASAIDRACGGDAALRAAVASLLGAMTGEQPSPAVDVTGLVQGLRRRLDANDEARAALPERIGRYRIVRPIGAGGMGDVYEAEQDHPRRTLALKILRPGLTSTSLLARFQREAQALASLHHPAIAHVYDSGEVELSCGQGGRPAIVAYIAMELVDGLPLDRFAQERGLDTRGRLMLFIRLCDGVEHAHARRVIHRDLKPGNVLVDGDGQPKILDFGIARLDRPEEGGFADRTATGQLMGTLPYMSPEQLAGDARHVDARGDVYSLGVMLHELLTGRLPHDLGNRSLGDAIRLVLDSDAPSLAAAKEATRHEAFASDLVTIVGRALEREPDRRYPSAAELAADLRRHLADEPILARPPGTIYKARKLLRRRRTAAAGIAAVLVVLVASGLVLALRDARADREHARQRSRIDRQGAVAGLESAIEHLASGRPDAVAAALEGVPALHRGWMWRHLSAAADSASWGGRLPAVLDGAAGRGPDRFGPLCLLGGAEGTSDLTVAIAGADRAIGRWRLACDAQPRLDGEVACAGHPASLCAVPGDAGIVVQPADAALEIAWTGHAGAPWSSNSVLARTLAVRTVPAGDTAQGSPRELMAVVLRGDEADMWDAVRLHGSPLEVGDGVGLLDLGIAREDPDSDPLVWHIRRPDMKFTSALLTPDGRTIVAGHVSQGESGQLRERIDLVRVDGAGDGALALGIDGRVVGLTADGRHLWLLERIDAARVRCRSVAIDVDPPQPGPGVILRGDHAIPSSLAPLDDRHVALIDHLGVVWLADVRDPWRSKAIGALAEGMLAAVPGGDAEGGVLLGLRPSGEFNVWECPLTLLPAPREPPSASIDELDLSGDRGLLEADPAEGIAIGAVDPVAGLVALAHRSTVRLLEAGAGRERWRVRLDEEDARRVGALAIDPRSRFVAVGAGEIVHLLDLGTGSMLMGVPCDTGRVTALCWLDGDHLLAGSSRGRLVAMTLSIDSSGAVALARTVVDVQAGRPVGASPGVAGAPRAVSDIVVAPATTTGGPRALVALRDDPLARHVDPSAADILVLDLQGLRCLDGLSLKVAGSDVAGVDALAIHRDLHGSTRERSLHGTPVAIATADGIVLVRDADRLEVDLWPPTPCQASGPGCTVRGLCFAGDGRELLVGREDGALAVVDAGGQLCELQLRAGGVRAMGMSPSDELLVATFEAPLVRLSTIPLTGPRGEARRP